MKKMSFYFYNGQIPVPVRRIDGEIVVVTPRSVVEAKPQDVRKYGSRMVRTAPPRVREQMIPRSPVAEMKPSPMAEKITELGGVRSKDAVPPVVLAKEREPEMEKVDADFVDASGDGAADEKPHGKVEDPTMEVVADTSGAASAPQKVLRKRRKLAVAR